MAGLNDKVHPPYEAILLKLGELAVLFSAQKATQCVKENKETNTFQSKQDKNSENYLNEMEISDLPDEQVKVTLIKTVTELGGRGGRMHEETDNFHRDRKYKEAPKRSHGVEDDNN